jgi:hypothetical protein
MATSRFIVTQKAYQQIKSYQTKSLPFTESIYLWMFQSLYKALQNKWCSEPTINKYLLVYWHRQNYSKQKV